MEADGTLDSNKKGDNMNLVCRRLPPSEETLKFLSAFLEKPHIQNVLDDRLKTFYGIYDLMIGIRIGKIRVYGVFDINPPLRFLGCELGELDPDGISFEHHAFWDRHVATVNAVNLCKNYMKNEFKNEGISVKYAVGHIPDCNRAAQLFARRAGAKDEGLNPKWKYYKNGKEFPCREFRIEV